MPHSEEFIVIINKNSGLVRKLGERAIEAHIATSSMRIKKLIFSAPEELEQFFSAACQENASVLVGGGDGTIAASASYFMRAGKPFGIIGLGTMNLLSRDLHLPLDIDQLLKEYAEGTQVLSIDVGDVNGHIFLCCAALGTIPETALFREEHRKDPDAILLPRLTFFVMQQMNREKHRNVRLRLDNHGKARRLKTAALVISNNQFTLEPVTEGPPLQKENLQDGVLGIYSARPFGIWDRIRLLMRLRLSHFGEWQHDPAIKVWRARELEVITHQNMERISLDGEVFDIKSPLRFRLMRQALSVIVPANIESVSSANDKMTRTF